MEGLDIPAVGDHKYVFPMISGVPICKEVFTQVNVLSEPAFAKGGVMFCETSTASLAEHPFAVLVTVSVYESGTEVVG